MSFLPVNTPDLSGQELKYVSEAVETGWISSMGPRVKEFEDLFASYHGVKEAVAVSSGTAALHICCVSLGIGPGDEVILPTFTMVASAFAVMYTGATPVFVDCEMDTWNMDIEDLKKKITAKTKAIMPVHIYGLPCNMPAIMTLAEERGIAVMEDAAEAHGAKVHGQLAGTFGKVNAFSFYANKIITTGEGGMVLTNDQDLADHLRTIKDLSHDPAERFSHLELSFNYRMTNLQAALGVAQMERIDEFLVKKRHMAKTYQEGFSKIEGITLPVEPEGYENVYWMYGILIDESFGLSRDEVMKKLGEKGIGTRSFFKPMHLQPAIHNKGVPLPDSLPVSEEIGRRGLYVPSGLALKDEDMKRVVQAMKDIHK